MAYLDLMTSPNETRAAIDYLYGIFFNAITIPENELFLTGRDGGDQIIVTITQEVFRRKFNSGFQNS
jgi:hypothetical protein